jgi:hypothetical protein
MATITTIVNAVAARIGSVTSLTGKVFVDRRTALSATETLAVYVQRGPKSIPEGAEFGPKRRELPVECQVLAQGTTADALVIAALDNIEAAVRSDPRLGGLARVCTYEQTAPAEELGDKNMAAQTLIINVNYIET